MDYSEEETVFDFEDDSIILSVWIDKYVDDPEYADEGFVPENAHIKRNGLACGRGYDYKDGSAFGWMCSFDVILTSDVIGLRDGVQAFAARETDHFGPFPQKDPYGGDRPFFTLELMRDAMGNTSFRAEVDVKGSGKRCAEGPITAKRLDELGEYYARIAEWFPPREE